MFDARPSASAPAFCFQRLNPIAVIARLDRAIQ
jgi:hypothetical protein